MMKSFFWANTKLLLSPKRMVISTFTLKVSFHGFITSQLWKYTQWNLFSQTNFMHEPPSSPTSLKFVFSLKILHGSEDTSIPFFNSSNFRKKHQKNIFHSQKKNSGFLLFWLASGVTYKKSVHGITFQISENVYHVPI